jgi:alpha-galactosidase
LNKEKGSWWENVGNWMADKERFPRGLRPVADAVHATGAKFMVWFEPERVRPGTMIEREHPEWILKRPGSDNYLFNLGNKDALRWLTDYITDFVKKEGIDYYRQDFNFNPMPYWELSDAPDRIGISEIRHIEGLYAFWDSLLVRFPALLIDNCAGGGGRIDLETTSRSSPLWRTDYQYGEPNGYQCHTLGLNLYIPIHGTAIYRTDSYTFRSGLGAAGVMSWEITGKSSEPIPSFQKRIREFKELRPYFYGDFYPLTENKDNTVDDVWIAYQLNRPDKNDGLVMAFRRPASETQQIHVRLHGLQKDAIYEVFFEDYGIRVKKKGDELMERVDLSIPQAPGSLMIKYEVAKD